MFDPSFVHDPLKDEVVRYANWALSWNAKRTYTSGEKRFISFCLMNRLASPTGDVLPASEGTHLFSVLFSSHSSIQHCTIKINLAALRNLHIVSGYNDPLQGKLLLKKILRGILCYQGCSCVSRQPGTPGSC